METKVNAKTAGAKKSKLSTKVAYLIVQHVDVTEFLFFGLMVSINFSLDRASNYLSLFFIVCLKTHRKSYPVCL